MKNLKGLIAFSLTGTLLFTACGSGPEKGTTTPINGNSGSTTPTNPTNPSTGSQIDLPTFKIVTPSVVTGKTAIGFQITGGKTSFSLADTKATVEILDARGQRVLSTQVDLVQYDSNVYYAQLPIDFNATMYNNENYTIRASVKVNLQGESVTRVLTNSTLITNQGSSGQAPALSILMPAFYDDKASLEPVLNRQSAVFIQMSSNTGISKAQLQFTCDVDSGEDCSKYPNTLAYDYNIPVGAAGIHYQLLPIGFQMDGQPFLPDGHYIMRLTAVDGGGIHNIKEMKVYVNRSAPSIADIQGVSVQTAGDENSKFSPASAIWTLQGERQHNVRVIAINDSNGTLSYSFSAVVTPETSISFAQGFIAAGSYTTSFLIQDLVTGVVEYYQGPSVAVSQKQ